MQKAQGALEYLLLIGGAVLVAVVVITLILGITDTAGTETETTVGSAFDAISDARAAQSRLPNIVTNSDAESGMPFLAASINGTRGTVALSTVEAHSGLQSVKFTGTVPQNEFHHANLPAAAILDVGTTYYMEVWVYNPSDGGTPILRLVSAINTYHNLEETAKKDEWVKLSGTFTVDGIGQSYIAGDYHGSTGDYWYFDDWIIQEQPS